MILHNDTAPSERVYEVAASSVRTTFYNGLMCMIRTGTRQSCPYHYHQTCFHFVPAFTNHISAENPKGKMGIPKKKSTWRLYDVTKCTIARYCET